MKTLVVVPTSRPSYLIGFSAPLAWLCAGLQGSVRGIFGFELPAEPLSPYDAFVVELNWFTQLHEFTLIVDSLRKRRPGAPILFGGLYASLAYPEIFAHCPVDYHIRGDNEGPLRQFLQGAPSETIPNLVGRDFANEQSYVFRNEDWATLEFELDWFPGYQEHIKNRPDESFFQLPMLLTAKGGCTAVHEGCDYCMGAQHRELAGIYRRGPLEMDNPTLVGLLRKLDRSFGACSLYVMTPYHYDLGGEHFQNGRVEVDSPVEPGQVANLFQAFERCQLLLPLYVEGVMGRSPVDHRALLALEDRDHSIKFKAYAADRERFRDIPARNVDFLLDTVFSPSWAHWNTYRKFENSQAISHQVYRALTDEGLPVFQGG